MSIEPNMFSVATQQFNQFFMDYFDDLLSRRKLLGNFPADGLLGNRVNEVFSYPVVDIGFQKGHAHFTQGILDILLAQAGLAGDGAQAVGKAIT